MITTITDNLQNNTDIFNMIFQKENSADIVKDNLEIDGQKALLIFTNGLSDSSSLLKIKEKLLSIKSMHCKTIDEFTHKYIIYADVSTSGDIDKLTVSVLEGKSVLIIDGYDTAIILDTKKYPIRSIEEPEKSKTLRGPKDGFTESIMTNAALVRRRIKSNLLKFESFNIGSITNTKVFLSYIEGKAKKKSIDGIRKKLEKIDIPSLTLTQEALTEALFGSKFIQKINPFPKVRFIERPDTASSMLMEGKIMILCDNTPTAIFIPMTLYDFLEEADDYYFPPVTASYLRTLRIFVVIVAIYLTPVWLLIVNSNINLGVLSFINPSTYCVVPLWIQLLLIEFMIDALKIASLNTPSTIANSLSVVSGLFLGDYAVNSGWLYPETILYSSICAIANYIPTNYELGYCFKFLRMTLLLLSQLFGIYGFIAGNVVYFILILSMKNSDNENYLFPLYPFSKIPFIKLFFRTNSGREEKNC